MKKLITLTIAMLMVNATFVNASDDFEQAKSKVYTASERIKQQHQRRAELEARINQNQQKISQIQGNPEYNAEHNRLQEETRQLVNQLNHSVEECKTCIDHLGKELHSVSSRYYVTGEKGTYDIVQPKHPKLNPIVYKHNTNDNLHSY